MDSIIDQKMLRNQQYKTPNNLQARMEIHRRFSRTLTLVPWFEWEYQELAIQPGQTILDLGCGPGELWRFQRNHLPANSTILLCDLSAGMVATSAQNLAGLPPFRYAVGDAQRIPLQDRCCDLVTANHMLYHVPDISQAVSEIRRVLKAGGRLAAATNGASHLLELYGLICKVVPGYQSAHDSAKRFGLENGKDLLRPFFDQVDIKYFEDNLWVTEPEPLVAYIDSMWGFGEAKQDLLPKFYQEIEAEIHEKGGFFIQKSTGILLAQ